MQMTQNESFANTNGTEEKNICVDDERYIGCHQQRYLNIRIRVIPTPVVLLSARPDFFAAVDKHLSKVPANRLHELGSNRDGR